jgi:hypothetical protein
MLDLIHRGPYESKPRHGWGCRHSGGTVFYHMSRYQKASVCREPDRVFDGDGWDLEFCRPIGNLPEAHTHAHFSC